MSELPINWRTSTIGEVAFASKERGDPTVAPDSPYVGLEHIEKNTAKLVGKGTAAEVKSTKSVFLEGDLLYGKLRPYLNKVWLAEFDGMCSTDILVFPKTEFIENKFLKYRFLARDFVNYADANSSGVNLPRVNLKALSKFEIDLPPLPEQRRIVARIEELFSRLDAGVAALRQAKTQLQRYRQSVLAAAVTGQLTPAWREQHPDTEPAEELLKRISNARAVFFKSESKNSEVKRHVSKHKLHKFKEPENWSTPTTWKFASLLTSCQFVVDCHNKTPPYEDSGIPLIRTTNVRCGQLAWSKIKFVNEKTAAHWSQRCTPDAGDILFTREAPAGEAAIVPENTRLCMGQRMMLFRTFHDLLLPSYLLTVIQSHNFQAQYSDKQVGVGVQHLRVGDVESLVLPIPPLAEQHQIVAEVEARTTAIDHLEAELDRQITRSNRLRRSLLANAFRGKI